MSTQIYTCVLLVGLACVSLCQVVNEVAMERAVSRLADKFRTLRMEELGVEVLEDEFGRYPPRLDDIWGEEDILSLLASPNLQDVLNYVTNDLNAVLSAKPNSTIETVSQCCSTSSSPCCYSCPSQNYSALLVEAETIFQSSSADSALFQLGLSDGALLVQPSTAPPADEECVELDSRFQPWYVAATSDQPRVVAIVVDITASPIPSIIKAAVSNVIQSLSATDMVSMTLIVNNMQQFTGGLYLANNCSKTKLLQELDDPYMSSFTVNRKDLLEHYVRTLNSSSIADRILMVVTDAGSAEAYSFSAEVVQNVSRDINTTGISLQVYFANDAVPQDHPLNDLLDAVNATARNVTDISGYYSHLIRPSDLPTSLQITSSLDSNGELFLSISGILLDEGDVAGVVNAQLPWKTLLQSLNGSLTGRQQSYFFVVDNRRNIWYHDRAANMITHSLSPSLLEPEEAFSGVLDMTANGAENVTVPVTKIVLLPRTGELEGSYLLQRLPATYYCHKSATVDGTGVSFYTCLLLAQEDSAFITGWEGVDVQDVYSDTPSREPILHSAVADHSGSSSCSYFCHQSIHNRISLQLTSPIETLATDADITAYIDGSGPLPDGIPSGTAEEVAILSSVSKKWIQTAPWEPTSILHRHVATPTGIYMQYPPLTLEETFLPQELVWYRGAVSQVDMLALSPPSEDIVFPERQVYSFSWSLRDNNAQLLAVMAATSTVSSLRVEVDAALDGECSSSSEVDCMVINDEGFFIVNPRKYPDQSYFAEVDRYSTIVTSLLQDTESGNESFLLQKRGCNDFENGAYYEFYWINTDNGEVSCGSTDSIHYCIQKIPESNAFLVVVEPITNDFFSLCLSDCFECPKFNPTAASCFCSCEQEMCTPSVIDLDVFTLCPTSMAVNPNYMLASTGQYRGSFCWDSAQCCSLDQGSCESTSTCTWCSERNLCTAVGTCCSGDSSCCFDGPSCFVSYCSTPEATVCFTPSPSPSPSMEMSNINTEAAIIGGVVGGIFAVFLLALLIVCCVWYQVFRAPVDETHKEKGVFDLTGIRADATNQTAIEITEKPGEPVESPGENGDTVKQDLSGEKSEATQL